MNENKELSRRGFIAAAAGVAMGAIAPRSLWAASAETSKLASRPRKPDQPWAAGLTRLWEDRSSAALYVPKSYDPAKAIPLVVALHGAGGRSNGPLRTWTPHADASGFALLVPESSSTTWDAIRGLYGEDVKVIDRALDLTFARLNVAPDRIVLQGFSDGASYGLGLGLMNGDLFTRIIANSPGFITRLDRDNIGRKPSVFVSHGRRDQVLPFENTVGRWVPGLRNLGCRVEFREFDGGHTVPVDIAGEAAKFAVK